MFKWLKSDEARSQELFNELQALDAEKPGISEKKKALDGPIYDAFRLWVKERSCGNWDEAVKADQDRQRLLSQKFSLDADLHRRIEEASIKLRELTGPYIQQCISDLSKVVKQILGQKKFEIVGKGLSKDKGTRTYEVKHNYEKISNLVADLMKTMDEIRGSDLKPISVIKAIYETAMRDIPDAFPLTDFSEGGSLLLDTLREGQSSIEMSSDNFTTMNLEQGKALADVSRLKGIMESIKGFKKIFARA